MKTSAVQQGYAVCLTLLVGGACQSNSLFRNVGEIERASAELAETHKLSGDDRHSSIAKLKAVEIVAGNWGVPKIRALFEATYFVGLRKAGMPEE
jgi:hypothetical protein